MRNIRRESVDKIKAAEKDKDIGKDDSKGFQVSFLIYHSRINIPACIMQVNDMSGEVCKE